MKWRDRKTKSAYTEKVLVKSLLEGTFGCLAKLELAATKSNRDRYKVTKTCLDDVVADILQLTALSTTE